jgi:hypothetical protein
MIVDVCAQQVAKSTITAPMYEPGEATTLLQLAAAALISSRR